MSDVSLSVSLQDKYSDKLSDMATVSTNFSKQLSAMSTQVVDLETKQSSLTDKISAQITTVANAKTAANEAATAYKNLGTDASKISMETANAAVITSTQRLTNLKSEANLTSKSILDIATSAEKLARTEYTSSIGVTSTGTLSSIASTASAVISATAVSQVADVATEALGTVISSAFDSSTGNVVSSALSSAISGATAGALIGQVPGAIIGAVAGGLVGATSGAISNWSNEDDYYKSYVSDSMTTAMSGTSDSVSSGSSTAATRETYSVSFESLLDNDAAAETLLSDLKGFSNSTPYLFDDLTSISKTILTYAENIDEDTPDMIMSTLESVGNAGAALGLTTDSINTVATTLGKIASKDTVTSAYATSLIGQGINVYSILAERDGIETDEVMSNISEYSGKETAAYILEYFDSLYGGNTQTGELSALEKQSETYSGKLSTLEGWETEVANASGDAYNTARIDGMSDQIDFLSGASGEALQEAYSIIGSSTAYLENLSEQYTREALDAMLTGAETTIYDEEGVAELEAIREAYVEALDRYNSGDWTAALDIESLVQTAEMIGTMAYDSSEEYGLLRQSEEDLYNATLDLALVFTGWEDNYALQQAETRGMISTAVDAIGDFISALFTTTATDSTTYSDTVSSAASNVAGRYADGLDTVPYDNFPALLHEGEQVVPAREVRANSGGTTLNISGNNFTIREEADVKKVAAEIVQLAKLEQMAGVY